METINLLKKKRTINYKGIKFNSSLPIEHAEKIINQMIREKQFVSLDGEYDWREHEEYDLRMQQNKKVKTKLHKKLGVRINDLVFVGNQKDNHVNINYSHKTKPKKEAIEILAIPMLFSASDVVSFKIIERPYSKLE